MNLNDNIDAKKSCTLELTINPGYVKSWGCWEACRELIQNAMDAHDQGYEMSIERGSGMTKTIYIRNKGISLPRSALLLGTTSKDGGGFRGKFGEGLKLALLVLARKEIQVKVRTGSDQWAPELGQSEAFGDTLLKVRVTPRKYENEVEIQIHGLCDEDWDTLQSRLLNVPGLPKTKIKKDEAIEVNGAKILTAERFKGKLFVRGIFIGLLPDQYDFGYDLPNVEVDRDRKMADVWSLRAQLSNVLAAAVGSNKLSPTQIMELLGHDSGEALAIAARYESSYVDSDELTKTVTKAFKEKHGEDALPVSSMNESLEAEHHGMKGKMVSKAIKHLIEKEDGTFETRKKAKERDAQRLYEIEELTQEERENLLWALRLMTMVEPNFTQSKLQVVDFFSSSLTGTYSPEQICLAKTILSDKRELMATVVHEFSHGWGDDGSASHERKIEMIFAEIVVQLSA